jgi:hypothetical protein
MAPELHTMERFLHTLQLSRLRLPGPLFHPLQCPGCFYMNQLQEAARNTLSWHNCWRQASRTESTQSRSTTRAGRQHEDEDCTHPHLIDPTRLIELIRSLNPPTPRTMELEEGRMAAGMPGPAQQAHHHEGTTSRDSALTQGSDSLGRLGKNLERKEAATQTPIRVDEHEDGLAGLERGKKNRWADYDTDDDSDVDLSKIQENQLTAKARSMGMHRASHGIREDQHSPPLVGSSRWPPSMMPVDRVPRAIAVGQTHDTSNLNRRATAPPRM